MRQTITCNDNWSFSRDCDKAPDSIPVNWEQVRLPHTWNALDGQDGGGDYWRGVCCYAREIGQFPGREAWLHIPAAASSARVLVNGRTVAVHEGGYSAFRVNITEALTGEHNILAILTDNGVNDRIYPQTADFTFYGGLYRGVSLILTGEIHFNLSYYGGDGLAYSAKPEGDAALVTLDAWITNPLSLAQVEFIIRDREGRIVAEAAVPAQDHVSTCVRIENVHLWQGVEDPYLYRVTSLLTLHNEAMDRVDGTLGVRTFYADPEKGFFLNGIPTPLRGVSRHQDMAAIGNALEKEQHQRDAGLIRELGANTVRLAHYQHNQDFYDACDRLGLVVWAEIPFISVMNPSPESHENCISQMKELIIQNYNHPSICFWGISNEITIGGDRPRLLGRLQELNELVHSMDSTRLSTMAQVSSLPMDHDMNRLTDVVAYNHYFGWYLPGLEKNEEWLDRFHQTYPDRPLGLSEYGAEGIITYHSSQPACGDYSEEYQALYHEHMAKIIHERPWLWCSYVWNMFDFGCDFRDEGGVKGRNNKGLMTLDRTVKKDSFYLYQAYWSQEPFVHLCGKRYSQRTGAAVSIKVYSNLPSVSLKVNGEYFEKMTGEKVFVFQNVPLSDCTMISAGSGSLWDSMTLTKTVDENPDYRCSDVDEDDAAEGAANWFRPEDYSHISTLEFREGYFSVRDKMEDILSNEEASATFLKAYKALTGMRIKKGMLNMMKDMTVEAMCGLGISSDQGDSMVIALNEALKRVSK